MGNASQKIGPELLLLHLHIGLQLFFADIVSLKAIAASFRMAFIRLSSKADIYFSPMHIPTTPNTRSPLRTAK